MDTGHIEINGKKYPVLVTYEHRHNSRASIGRNSINIRMPDFLNRDERYREVLKLKQWAEHKLKERPELQPEPKKEYKDGDILKVGTAEYVLRIALKDKQSSSAHRRGSTIALSLASSISEEDRQEHASSLISRCVAGERLPQLKEKILKLNAAHFNQKINKIFFKNISSRWGSCSRAGNINISTRLLFAPDNVLESVCIHELAHLIEHNHSERFWALVERAMPNHKEARAWLKENGKSCGF